MKNNALRISPADNVVIALQDLKKGSAVILDNEKVFEVAEDIPAGHKIALKDIAAGEKVYRYGEPILETTRAIRRGEWVHLHNARPCLGDLTA